jgi:hypothetical protein
MEGYQNKTKWCIRKNNKKVSTHIKGVGRVINIDDIVMIYTNICRVILAIVNISEKSLAKPILHHFAWKMFKFFGNKHTKMRMCNNKNDLVHLHLVCMRKLNQILGILLPTFA